MKHRKYVSLFSGAMGLDIGLANAGFHPILCNEIDRASVETIRLNLPKLPVLDCSIENITGEMVRRLSGLDGRVLELLAGGPPCQSFSVYGNRSGSQDGRGQLIFEYMRLVDELRPKTFLMENVRGLHSMPLVPEKFADKVNDLKPWMLEKGSLLREIFVRFEAIGYRIDAFLVNSANYGASQIRERLILVGNRFNLEARFPQPSHSNRPSDGLPPFNTLRAAIGDGFEDPDRTLMDFSARKLKYLSMVPPGGNWRSLPVETQQESMGKSWYLKGGRSATWRRLSWDFPSPTVVTLPNHASTSMCHPEEVRALTAGECAAIQGFPPSWKFYGSASERYRQIGNAVPVALGSTAGECIADLLDRIRKIECNYTRPAALTPSTIDHLRPHVRTKRYWHNGKALAGDFSYYDDEDGERSRDQAELFAINS